MKRMGLGVRPMAAEPADEPQGLGRGRQGQPAPLFSNEEHAFPTSPPHSQCPRDFVSLLRQSDVAVRGRWQHDSALTRAG
jgi:hypothetical protein